jgi:hypothetical protein
MGNQQQGKGYIGIGSVPAFGAWRVAFVFFFF